MTTNGDILRARSERKSIPLRTLDDVRADLAQAKKSDTDVRMARLMLRHGRLAADARAWLTSEYPQGA